MSDLREEFLGRLTRAGWALIVLDGLGVALLGPYLLIKLSPAALAMLAGHRRLMGLAWFALVVGVFVLGKWLLERGSITILRACEEGKCNAPPPPEVNALRTAPPLQVSGERNGRSDLTGAAP